MVSGDITPRHDVIQTCVGGNLFRNNLPRYGVEYYLKKSNPGERFYRKGRIKSNRITAIMAAACILVLAGTALSGEKGESRKNWWRSSDKASCRRNRRSWPISWPTIKSKASRSTVSDLSKTIKFSIIKLKPAISPTRKVPGAAGCLPDSTPCARRESPPAAFSCSKDCDLCTIVNRRAL